MKQVILTIPDPKQIYFKESHGLEYPTKFTQRYLHYSKLEAQNPNNIVIHPLYGDKHSQMIKKILGEGVFIIDLPESAAYKEEMPSSILVSLLRNNPQILKDILSDNSYNLAIKPYSPQKYIKQIGNEIINILKGLGIFINGFRIIGENDIDKVDSLEGKKFLHPKLGEPSSSFQEKFKEVLPVGFFVDINDIKNQGIDVVLKSINEIKKQTGKNSFFIKAINGAGGEGIIKVFESEGVLCYKELNSIKNLSEYNFPMGSVIIEEALSPSNLGDILSNNFFSKFKDEPITITIHYQDGKLFGNPLLQLTTNNERVGNISMSNDVIELLNKAGISENDIKHAEEITKEFIDFFGFEGNGCIDFMRDKKKRKFILLDPNIGRDGGDMPLKWYMKNKKEGNFILFNGFKPGIIEKSNGQIIPTFLNNRIEGGILEGENLNDLLSKLELFL